MKRKTMKNGKKINKRRKFSDEFKKFIVSEYEKGKFTVLELSRMHDVGFQLIYKWIYKFSTINSQTTVVVELQDSDMNKLKHYEKRIKELEQIVGQKQLKIDYLERLIDLAETHYGEDFKKNSNTQPS